MSDKVNSSGTAGNQDKVNDPSKRMQAAYGDFLSTYKGLSETTSKVVQQAATILESEIAAGIDATKKIEEQYSFIDRSRSEKPDEIVQRFRRDAHEVVDIFIDVVGTAFKSMNTITNTITIHDYNITNKHEQVVGPRSVITAPQTAKAGEIAEIPISFENSGNTSIDEFKLYGTDLISESGGRISSAQIKFMPAALKIGAHQTAKVIVIVAVPTDAKAGVYSGLVLAANMNQLRSDIILKVE